MMKWIIFSLIIITFLMSCDTQDKFKIGFLIPSKERFDIESGFFSEKAKELGCVPLIVKTEFNETAQMEAGFNMLKEQDINLLIIAAVNGNTIAPLVREAKNSGIPVIAYNMLINNVDYDVFFSGDNDYLAKLFCESALEYKPSGNYVVLGGDRFDRNGVELKNGIDSLLKPYTTKGDINIIYETYIEGWSRENAMYEFQQVIDVYGTNIDVILSSNDGMADGVIEVLEKHKTENQIFITGQDADIIGVRNVFKGKQSMTVYHPAKEYGYGVAELAFSLLQNKNPEDLTTKTVFNGLSYIPNVMVKSIKITASNINKELIETGVYDLNDIQQ